MVKVHFVRVDFIYNVMIYKEVLDYSIANQNYFSAHFSKLVSDSSFALGWEIYFYFSGNDDGVDRLTGTSSFISNANKKTGYILTNTD